MRQHGEGRDAVKGKGAGSQNPGARRCEAPECGRDELPLVRIGRNGENGDGCVSNCHEVTKQNSLGFTLAPLGAKYL